MRTTMWRSLSFLAIAAIAPFLVFACRDEHPGKDGTYLPTEGNATSLQGGPISTAVGSATNGTLLMASASSTWTTLTPGPSGSVLMSNGPDTTPVWTAFPNGSENATALQSVPISDAGPEAQTVLAFVADAWTPVTGPTASGQVLMYEGTNGTQWGTVNTAFVPTGDITCSGTACTVVQATGTGTALPIGSAVPTVNVAASADFAVAAPESDFGTSLASGPAKNYIANKQTTSATAATYSLTQAKNTCLTVMATAQGIMVAGDAGTVGDGFSKSLQWFSCENDAGTISAATAATSTPQTVGAGSSWAASASASAPNIVFSLTGTANATVDWTLTLQTQVSQ